MDTGEVSFFNSSISFDKFLSALIEVCSEKGGVVSGGYTETTANSAGSSFGRTALFKAPAMLSGGEGKLTDTLPGTLFTIPALPRPLILGEEAVDKVDNLLINNLKSESCAFQRRKLGVDANVGPLQVGRNMLLDFRNFSENNVLKRLGVVKLWRIWLQFLFRRWCKGGSRFSQDLSWAGRLY